MAYLIIVSVVWGFSFGLIKGNLAGLDPYFVSLVRLSISLIVFLPFLRVRRMAPSMGVRLILTGAVQYGLMYAAYIHSYSYLPAHLVAVFTIFTPVYITVLEDVMSRRFHSRSVLMALAAVAGAAVITGVPDAFELRGFLLVQLSNICFAFGQVYYRRVLRGVKVSDASVFALLYAGGAGVCAVLSIFLTRWSEIRLEAGQMLTLLYLGVVASGLCFFLWNRGVRLSSVTQIAVMNNAKIPLAVAFSLLLFGESAGLPGLLAGGGILTGVLVLDHQMKRIPQ